MFHHTIEVDKSMNEAVSALEASLKEEKFGVLWSLNMKETLAGKGVELDGDYIILEVCNPHEAKRVLEKNPIVSYFLPCKIVVYKENDKTKVGLPKPTELIKFVENDELQTIAADIEKRLIGAIDNIK
ncbi:DUF302 domain-containing protein [Mesobacillus jeotgali]|jgi:uncharacterized protein (DUF302 family)|uniref:DUF302 domain-containing protein n=1 Tax=Mesobacillus jeotgali TaxID=129985 RepID=A0ABY9VSI8_9BACI|nr:DUF302 domain-containing protein [Mesobacillus jeotgali]WNF23941.1 DUF302 domain-containing protein [Mesobacillus jeotgali]